MSTQTLTADDTAPTRSACPIHGLLSVDADGAGPFQRLAVFGYGLVAYAMFMFTILYAIGFVGGWVVPKHINSGTPGALLPSMAINSALLALFAIQHAVMARPAFKRVITRVIPKAAERSTYVVAACATLLLLFYAWQPMPQIVWDTQLQSLRVVLVMFALAGWVVVFASSFMINHFDLFGLHQVWSHLFQTERRDMTFRVAGFYRFVRHPLMTGFLVAFWVTPTMTVGHLLFAVLTTLYIVLDVYLLEERDLIAAHGDHYRQYKRSVPGLIPYPKHLGRA